MSKKRKSSFNNMPVLTFNTTILLMSVGTRTTMEDTKLSEECVKRPKFPTPISLNTYNFSVKITFNL